MKLLLVEDDQSLATNLKSILSREGFAVDIADTAESGQVNTEVNEYDCLILDINLPDASGFDLLNRLRQAGDATPVIIVTARDQTEDRILGLNIGADDYIPKPVDSHELIARIRAVIRRSSQHPLPVITVGQLIVLPAQQSATIAGHSLSLTAKEFSVLEYLAIHAGQVVTRTMLMEHIWGSDFDTFSNVIDVYIKNLRRAFSRHTHKELIRTIRGKGYILGPHEKSV